MAAGWSRRNFARAAIAGGALAVAAPYSWRFGRAAGGRVVVIGGGAGGATAARALSAAGDIEVTLVEPKTRYTTCFHSNRYIGGLGDLDSLTHSYDTLAARHGVKVVHDRATAIDPVAKAVRLAGGGTLQYDRLIVSPGVGFRPGGIEGYDQAAADAMPHAWRAGPQTALLRRRLEAMEDGAEFLIAPPARPYRCTTAPYERASLVAHYFTRAKPNARITILDANDRYPLQDLFEEAWNRFYPGMIEVLPGEFSGGARAVDAATGEVFSDDESFRPALANIIPPQRAGRIAVEAGLADDSGWCPVDADGFESTLAPAIHVIGDAAIAAPMPKAAYSARRQAHLCAAAIRRELSGSAAQPGQLGGACWSLLAPGHAVREYAEFAVGGGKIERTLLDISPTGESDETRATAAAAGEQWYRDITADMFG